MTSTLTPLSGAFRVEWRDIAHHSPDNAPLNDKKRETR